MAKKMISDGNFVVGDNPPKSAVSPRMGGKPSKAPVGDAKNSASPGGSMNIVKMVGKDGSFKTGHSK